MDFTCTNIPLYLCEITVLQAVSFLSLGRVSAVTLPNDQASSAELYIFPFRKVSKNGKGYELSFDPTNKNRAS